MATYTYNEDIKNIERIDFSVFGNDEVKRYSAVNKELHGITLPESYENGEPKKGGLNDARLGVTDSHFDCVTCGLDKESCPGHFGHTELAEPMFHYGYAPTVRSILSCVCLRCSKLLVYKTEEEIEYMIKHKSGKARFNEIRSLCQSVNFCQRSDGQRMYGCGAPIPKIKLNIDKASCIIQMRAEYNLSGTEDTEEGKQIQTKKTIREILTQDVCYNILKNISDMDCLLMGFDPTKTRPEDLIYMNFPIPTVAIRPSARLEFLASTVYEDGVTTKLIEIVRKNNEIRKSKDKEMIGESTRYEQNVVNLLQYHVAVYFDNDTSSLSKSESKIGNISYKSLAERIKGKEGRIRFNLMGKRVNFSARTVITPDPNIGLDELGVPIKIAMNLTFPEIVTRDNIDELTKLVKNGRNVYPGANFIIPVSSFDSNKRYFTDLRYIKKAIRLKYGDIVERHLRDGDPVLFNRQPSLHKMSMMCHRIKIINDPTLNTFRLNVSATRPYNAD